MSLSHYSPLAISRSLLTFVFFLDCLIHLERIATISFAKTSASSSMVFDL
jgi:hypothetical protein